jgi:hypothetical protein
MKPRTQALLILGLVALLLRLWVALGSAGASYDMESYRRVASTLWEGRALYGDPALLGRYPYFPAWAILASALKGLSMLTSLPDTLCFKIPGLLGDLGIVFLLFLIMERLSLKPLLHSAPKPFWQGRPFWAGLAYAANPVSILISAGHGQFDSLVLFFVLLAAWHFEFSQAPLSDFYSALSLSAAIALKTWPVFLLPFFMKNLNSGLERRRYLLACLLPALLLLLPFALQGGWDATWMALNYSGSQALSLPEALRASFYAAQASPENFQAVAWGFKVLGLSCLGIFFAAYSLSAARFPLFPGLALGVLTLYVCAPAFAVQYLLWLLPLALLLPGRLALRHSAWALGLSLAFYSLFMPEAFLGGKAWAPQPLPTWLVLLWAVANLGAWMAFAAEWNALWRLCRSPKGRLEFN